MELMLSVEATAAADELRNLRGWLLQEEELRGRVRAVERPPSPGHLGPVLEALQIAVGPAAAALSASLVAWLRTRVGTVRVVVTPESGDRFELNARNVRGLDAEAIAALARQLETGGQAGSERDESSRARRSAG